MTDVLVKDEVRDVLARLARGTDRRDRALIASCYHPGAFDDHGGYQGDGDGFADWAVETLEMFTATMHFLGNSDIRISGGVVHSETYCTAHHLFPPNDAGVVKDSIMCLRYVDRFELRNRAWRIANRTCVFDFTYVVESTERWPLAPPFVVGEPGPGDPSYRLLES
jgi:hypothetical protein